MSNVDENPPLGDEEQREKDRAKMHADAKYVSMQKELVAKGVATPAKVKEVEEAALDEVARTRLRKAQIHASVMAVAAARRAKKEKMPVLEAEPPVGPAMSKTMQRKTKTYRGGIKTPVVLDLGAMAEAEVERVNPAESIPAETERTKKMGHRKKEKYTLKLLHEQRLVTLHDMRADWLDAERAKWKKANPQGTDEEAKVAVPKEAAFQKHTWEEVCGIVTLASFINRSTMTGSQRSEAEKIEQKQIGEVNARREELARSIEERMDPVERDRLQIQRKRHAHLMTVEWAQMGLKDHERRREIRHQMHLQLMMQRSVWLHSIVVNAYDHGIPQLDPRTLNAFFAPADEERRKAGQVTSDPKQALVDEEGDPVLARHPPGQRLCIEINVQTESVIQGDADWNPAVVMRCVGLEELEARLAHQSEAVANEASAVGRAHLREGERMMQELVRQTKAYSNTEIVIYLQIKCDMARPLRSAVDHAFGQTVTRTVHVIERDIQDNQEYIDSLGPFKGKTLRCHRDGAFILAGTPVRYGGKVMPMSERDKLSIKSCNRPDCAKASCFGTHPVFCSKSCKQKHVDEVHDTSGEARRRAYNKARKARKHANKLAEKAAIAAREGHDEKKDEADIAAATESLLEDDKERKSESEADDEIEV